MQKPKPHPKPTLLHERFGTRASAIVLRGYAGPSPEGTVRLFESPNGGDAVEIPQNAIQHCEQEDETEPAELYVDPWTVVTAVSVRKVPLTALAMKQKDAGPDGAGTGKSCLEKRIEKCKNDPDVKDKSVCESDELKRVFRLLCSLFGDPGGSIVDSDTAIV